jgi:hypothetical protein
MFIEIEPLKSTWQKHHQSFIVVDVAMCMLNITAWRGLLLMIAMLCQALCRWAKSQGDVLNICGKQPLLKDQGKTS